MADQPSLAWMDHVRLASLERGEGGRAVLVPRPGARGVASVVGEAHRERVASELSRLVGRRVRVELATPDSQTANRQAAPASVDKSTGASRPGRDDVLALPLVRDVLAVFPDALVVEVGEEPEGEKPKV